MFGKKRIDADKLPTYNTTKTACPVCGMVVCTITGMHNASDQGPKAGDGLVCANCCSVLQFTASGSLERFSHEDYEALDTNTKLLYNEWVAMSLAIIAQDLKDNPPPPTEVC